MKDTTIVRVEAIRKLDLQPGDVLHITLGGEINAGDQSVTWVPDAADLAYCATLWNEILPKDIHAIVTHHLVEPTVIQSHIRVGSWPPKVGKNAP